MRSFDEWFDENCDGSDLAKDACRKLWDEFSDQINIICRKSYEKQQSKVDELQRRNQMLSENIKEQGQKLVNQNEVIETQAEKLLGLRDEKAELQKRVDDLTELNRLKTIALQQSVNRTSPYVHEKIVALEQALKGGGE